MLSNTSSICKKCYVHPIILETIPQWHIDRNARAKGGSLPKYFGDGDRMHLLFNFQLNQRLFLAFARQSARPLRGCLTDLPKLPRTCQWANLLRNHDELNLGKLSEKERQECFRNFAPDEGMRLYGRGIRRRRGKSAARH